MLPVSSNCIPPLAPDGSTSSFVTVSFPSSWPGTASFTLLPLSMTPGNRVTQEAGIQRCKPRVGDSFVDFSRGIFAARPGVLVLYLLLLWVLFVYFRMATLEFTDCVFSQFMPNWSVHASVQVRCIFLESVPFCLLGQLPSAYPLHLVATYPLPFFRSTVAPLCISRIMTTGLFAPMCRSVMLSSSRSVMLSSSVHPKQARAIFLR